MYNTRILDALAVFIACALFLTACSSHGISNGNSVEANSNEDTSTDTSTAATSGTVVFPSGFALQPSILTVSSASGRVAVGSNGSYTVTEPAGGGAATVMLTDANGNIIMLGHVDTSNPSFNEISPTSTAEELLFLATGSFSLPQSVWPNIYTILAAAPETAKLAAVISTQMAANPTAVGDLDPVIVTEIDTEAASLLTGLDNKGSSLAALKSAQSSAASQSVQSYSVFSASTQTKAASDTGSLTVGTEASEITPIPEWGLMASPSDDHYGFYLTNQSRINRFYLVYRTGYIPLNGKITDTPKDVSPWEQVNVGLLPAVSGVSGFSATIADFINGQISGKSTWTPVDTPTIPLPAGGSDVLANTYKVYVVGMGSKTVAAPSDASAAEEVQKAAEQMCMYQGVKEILWPILTKILPIKSSPNMWVDKDSVAAAVTTFVKAAGSVGIAWQQQLYVNPTNVWPATKDLIKAAFTVGQSYIQDGLKALIKTLYKGGNANFVQTLKFTNFANKMFWMLSIVDGALTSGDIGSIIYMTAQSNKYNIYDVTAQNPTLELSPTSATISSSTQTATFFVKATGYLPNSLRYEWGPSTYGTFKTSCGSGNPVSCNGSQTAIYSLTGISLPNVKRDSFKVRVYDKSNVLRGTFTGTVNFTNVVINPSIPTVAQGTHKTFTVSLTSGSIPAGTNVAWSLNGCGDIVTGSLSGGCSVTSKSLTVDYLAPTSPITGNDILNVMLTDAGGNWLGSASTQISVGSAVSLSPDSPSLSLGAQQVFTLSAVNGFVVPASATYKWTVTGSGTVGGSGTTTTTAPTVTYTAPSSSGVDTLTVQVIYQGNAIASTSQKISVGVVTWTGSSSGVTNESSFPIYSTSQIVLKEYFVDYNHVYYTGTSIDDTGSTYSWTCGLPSAPLTVTDNGNGSDTIVIPDGIPLQNTNGPQCYTIMPGPINLIRTPTKLYFPGSTYKWSQACSYAVTRDYAFSLDNQ